MELADPEIQDILLSESEVFSGLAAKHASFEARLEKLSSKHLPSERERIEEIEIKKQKLVLKDQMAAMIRDYRRERLTAAVS